MARLSEFFFTKNPYLKKLFFRGGGGDIESISKKIFFFRGGGGQGAWSQ